MSNNADTRLIKKMRGGTPDGTPMTHTVQVKHSGRVIFEGTKEAANHIFEKFRFGTAAERDVYIFAEGI